MLYGSPLALACVQFPRRMIGLRAGLVGSVREHQSRRGLAGVPMPFPAMSRVRAGRSRGSAFIDSFLPNGALFLVVVLLFIPVRGLDVSLPRVSGLALLAVAAVRSAGGRLIRKESLAYSLAVGLVVLAGLAGGYAYGLVNQPTIGKMAMNAVLFASVMQVANNESRVRIVLLGVVCAAVFSVAWGVSEAASLGAPVERIAGPLGNANGFGGVCALGAVSVAGLSRLARRAWGKITTYAATAVLVVGLLYSGSRGAFLGFVAGYSVLLVLTVTRRAAVRRLAAVFVIGLALVPGTFLERWRTTFVERKAGMVSAADMRFDLYKSGWAIFAESPIVGVGAGNVGIEMENLDTSKLGVTHNVFTQLLAETGAIGTAAFAFVLISALARLRGVATGAVAAVSTAAFASAFLAVAVTLLVAQQFSGNYVHSIWYVVLGTAFAFPRVSLRRSRPQQLTFATTTMGLVTPRPAFLPSRRGGRAVSCSKDGEQRSGGLPSACGDGKGMVAKGA